MPWPPCQLLSILLRQGINVGRENEKSLAFYLGLSPDNGWNGAVSILDGDVVILFENMRIILLNSKFWTQCRLHQYCSKFLWTCTQIFFSNSIGRRSASWWCGLRYSSFVENGLLENYVACFVWVKFGQSYAFSVLTLPLTLSSILSELSAALLGRQWHTWTSLQKTWEHNSIFQKGKLYWRRHVGLKSMIFFRLCLDYLWPGI